MLLPDRFLRWMLLLLRRQSLHNVAVAAGCALVLSAAAAPHVSAALRPVTYWVLTLVSSVLNRFGRPRLQKDFISEAGFRGTDILHGAAELSGCQDRIFQRFSNLGKVLPSWLAVGLERQGFRELKPIQRQVLPLALAGRDVVGIAPTGSGKTLAFLVPALVHIAGQPAPRALADGPVALVLAPTRELAVQIGTVAEQLMRPSWEADAVKGFLTTTLYGGTRKVDQLQALAKRRLVHLVVATPGRLLDLIENHRAFRLRSVSFFVLDEGDRMLDFGFEPDVAAISRQIRRDRQMLFFSATWPPEVEQAASRLCSSGAAVERISALPASGRCNGETNGDGLAMPPREIRQIVEVISGGWGQKLDLLFQHLEDALGVEHNPPKGKAIIFVHTRRAAEQLGAEVANHFGLDRCGVMHGLRSQDQREATLKSFRDGHIHALVATDVLGRGVDIPKVSHVVIFDFPQDIETYIHRVGRTGRNGQCGMSIAFFEPQPWYPDLPRELADVLRACNQQVPSALTQVVDGVVGGSTQPQVEQQEPNFLVELVDGDVALATPEELGPWDAEGRRIWGYSANGGVSEQGRIEFRTGGRLRTTWCWGEWRLCSRPCNEVPASASSEETVTLPHMALSWNGVTDVVALDATGLSFELVSRNGRPAHTYRKTTVGRALPVGT